MSVASVDSLELDSDAVDFATKDPTTQRFSSHHCSDFELLRRLWVEAAPYRKHLLGIFLIGLLWSPLALLAPLPLKIAVDSAIGTEALPAFLGDISSLAGGLAIAVSLAVALALLGAVQGLGDSLLRTYIAEQLTLKFRSRLFRHAQRLSLAYHDRNGSFDATYRILGDAPCIQWVTIYGIIPVLTAVVTLASMVYVTAVIDWPLAVVALGVSPIMFALSRVHSRNVRPRWDRNRELEGETLSIAQEVLSMLRVVKAFGRESYEEDRFARRSEKVIASNVTLAAINGGFDLLKSLTVAVGGAVVLAVGVVHVRSGLLTVGELILVTGYIWQIMGPVHTISNSLSSMQVAFASARRAFAVLDRPPDADERASAHALHRARGEIQFQEVTFGYEGRQSTLDRVSFKVCAGTCLGIVGPSGSGKTTLLSLLMRFYNPSAGAILLDGQDIRDYRLADLRNQFAIVFQEPVLFSTSIAENIAYGRPDATIEQIIEAAKAANIHGFIITLPNGYQTQVGERGMSLSGGERQRISIARAFLKDAPVLILDEPTSSVDAQTEGAILEVLKRLIEGRTTLITAHRLSTLLHCTGRIELRLGQITSIAEAGEGQTADGEAQIAIRQQTSAHWGKADSSQTRLYGRV
jgi:ATP-binding cassette, subfamily B, bacterial